MKAMVLLQAKQPLIMQEVPKPSLKPKQILIKVHTCGVCRTDVHIADGELAEPHYPLILGHQVVGTVESLGPQATKHRIGERVGAPWLGLTCQKCPYCLHNQENLCDDP